MVNEYGRRAFLRLTAVAGAGLLSSCSQGATVDGVVAGDGTRPRAAGKASRPASPADWTALARDLPGRLVRPGESAYTVSKRLFDPRFDSLRPAGIAYCRDPHDVATCLAFARKFGVRVAARCGGHSYAGWSSTSGLIIDVTPMARVDVNGDTAVVGAGTRLIDFYSRLAAHGRAVPGGSCPTVGIAGLTLGGGVGVVSRAYGLTSDNVQSLQIVTADGQVRTCDSSQDSDLFWACRGGGGGNFGVVTSFTFTTHPVGDIVLFFLSWPWSQAAQVIAAWQSWAPNAPDALWSNVHLGAAQGGPVPSIQVGGTYLGGLSAAAAELENLYAAAGSPPSSPFIQTASWLDAMLIEAGCYGLTVDQCHLPTQTPGGQISRVSEHAKSDFFTKPLSSRGIGTLLSGVETFQRAGGAPGAGGGIAFDALGGAVNRVAPGATAFVHRNALFQAQYTTTWPTGSDPAAVARQYAWQQALWQSMRRYASGQAYQNYIDPALANWRQAYYGTNYPRLAQVKATYDPGRIFTFPQSV
ncbi:MAG TPA: FAD-binding oxidoreductase [Streptosporangiaceae bacterium]|nr:FAD-binding oxidoreductase [Streptosporangiaceae bacterium]